MNYFLIDNKLSGFVKAVVQLLIMKSCPLPVRGSWFNLQLPLLVSLSLVKTFNHVSICPCV